MGHAEAYDVLSQILVREIDKPFSFLDLACGDAYYSSRALRDTNVNHYTGIDLSEAALRAATEELKRLTCEIELIKGDFKEFERLAERLTDVIWIGLSLHHLDKGGKAHFTKRVYEALSEQGVFLIYEPVYLEDEDRASYLRRIERIIRSTWTTLSDEEIKILLEHVRTTEIPESRDTWLKLGKEAGFGTAEKIFSEPSGLYSLFKFTK